MDKKIITWVVLAIAVALVVVVAGYMIMQNNQKAPTPLEQNNLTNNTVTQPSQQDTTLQNTEQPSIDVQAQGVVTEGGGGLLVCVDRCGDKVCEKPQVCPKGGLNCVCDETPQSCPEDCVQYFKGRDSYQLTVHPVK